MTLVDYNVRATEARHWRPDEYDRPVGRWTHLRITSDPGEAPDWLFSVASQAVELLKLRPGWAGRGSRPVEPRLIQTLLADVLFNAMPPGRHAIAPQLVPTREGGVQLEWHRGGWDVEIDLSPYRRAWVDCERADGTDMWSGAFSDNVDGVRVVLKEIADR